jgi:hypothetical protein
LKQRLSSKLILEKIISVILFTAVIGMCFKSNHELLLIAVPILGVIDYILFYLPTQVEFDDFSVFIKTKDGVITVPYRQVTMLKLTGLSIGSKNIWKIKYYDKGREKTARFYPRNYSNTLGDFIKLLRTRNPNTKFISFSWSF